MLEGFLHKRLDNENRSEIVLCAGSVWHQVWPATALSVALIYYAGNVWHDVCVSTALSVAMILFVIVCRAFAGCCISSRLPNHIRLLRAVFISNVS